MQNRNKLIAFCFLAISLFSCTENRTYEGNIDLDNSSWMVDHSLDFEFEIKQPEKYYDLFFNIRYDADYPYRNIYIYYDLTDSTETSIQKQLVNFPLFTDKLGEPLGETNSNIISLQTSLADSVKFPFAGKYSIRMAQYMRTDSLTGVYSAGIKVMEAQSDAE